MGVRLPLPVREVLVAWLRMALAIQLVIVVVLSPLLIIGDPDILVLYTPLAVAAATPLAFFHRRIARKEAPFLGPGYWIAAIYGPVILISLAVVSYPGSERAAGFVTAVVFSVIYQIGALMVVGAYVLIWRLGDRWFGDAERPRVGRRWGLAAVAAVALSLYAPFTWRAIQWDACVDRGGSYRPGGWCNFDPNDTANNGAWPTD
jgi:hypothetical protein